MNQRNGNHIEDRGHGRNGPDRERDDRSMRDYRGDDVLRVGPRGAGARDASPREMGAWENEGGRERGSRERDRSWESSERNRESYGAGSARADGRSGYDRDGYERSRDFGGRSDDGRDYDRSRSIFTPDRSDGRGSYAQNERSYERDARSYGRDERGYGDRSMRDSMDRSDARDRFDAPSSGYAVSGLNGRNDRSDAMRSHDGSGYGTQQWSGQRQGSMSYGIGGFDGARSAQRNGKAPKNYTRSDERLREEVCDCLANSGHDWSDVDVTVSNGEVTLTGTVADRSEKLSAEHMADGVRGVKEVTNQLKIKRADASESRTSSSTSTSTSENGTSETGRTSRRHSA